MGFDSANVLKHDVSHLSLHEDLAVLTIDGDEWKSISTDESGYPPWYFHNEQGVKRMGNSRRLMSQPGTAFSFLRPYERRSDEELVQSKLMIN